MIIAIIQHCHRSDPPPPNAQVAQTILYGHTSRRNRKETEKALLNVDIVIAESTRTSLGASSHLINCTRVPPLVRQEWGEYLRMETMQKRTRSI